MKNVKFENKMVEKTYKNTIDAYRGVSSIILLLLHESRPIMIKDIINTEYGIKMIIYQENSIANINVDFLKRKIYLEKTNQIYQEIYDNYPVNNTTPIGYLYKNRERSITKKILYQTPDNEEKVYHYELNESGTHYVAIIKGKDELLDEENIILKLLYRNNKYQNIRDLFMAISEYVDINKYFISLADSKGGNVTINHGEFIKYIEYYEENGEYNKIYLKDGEFYIEKKITELYQDNLTAYVKKIGEANGKRKK